MIHTESFLDSLFLRPIVSSLLGTDSEARFLLRYWLAFPTRGQLNLYTSTPAPIAFFRRPNHVERARSLIVLLADTGFDISLNSTHKKIYEHRIKERFEQGHVELAHPSLDWTNILKTVPHLPPPLRDSFFCFNHRLFYTRDRANRLNATLDPQCERCKREVETADHLISGCSARAETINWLKSKLQALGCSGTWTHWVRGDVGQLPLNGPARLLVAVFLDMTWRTRQRKRLPSVVEYEYRSKKIVSHLSQRI
jgi:hypothetical protein